MKILSEQELGELKDIIDQLVDVHIDGLFEHAHEIAETESGDITPAQNNDLEEIKKKLQRVVLEQVAQNL